MVTPKNDLSNERSYYSETDLESLEYLDMPLPRRGRLHEMILEDPISQLNAPKPIVLEASDPVSKAVKLMKKFRYGSVLVQDDEWLVGIFTEKDLIQKTSGKNFDFDKVTLREVMTPQPQALNAGDTLAHALHLMAVGGYRHVPVLDGGHPVGFVSIRGILRYIAENAL
ncbi:MAG: CBS domain-containing protein [Planctomycetes bacterium]|nr:CBS domain-containing protein [Planctomycetota bacterium]